MKWFLSSFLLIFILSVGFFCKSYFDLYRDLNIHATEITSNSPLLQKAELKYHLGHDGQKIAFYSFPVKKPKAAIILVHGYSNPGGKNQMLDHVDYLNKAGYSAYLLDLRSFGDSDGKKISLGTKEWLDLLSFYDYLRLLPENKNLKIGYLGFSMGASASITALAQSGKGDFLIASVPFSSPESLYSFRLKQNQVFSFFTKLALRAQLGFNYPQYSAINNISKIRVPLLIFQATKDEYVNQNDAQDLYNLANSPKEFWQADSGHDIHSTLPQDFQQHVLTFLNKNLN